MFILLMGIAGIGFLIKYILVPGVERNAIYGKNVELSFLGIDRHQWGSIHLQLSFILLVLLLFHIIFHWQQIVSVFKRMIPDKTGRLVLTSVFAIVSIILCIIPLFVKPEIQQIRALSSYRNGYGSRQNDIFSDEKSFGTISDNKIEVEPINIKEKSNHKNEREFKNKKTNIIEIYGYMTLDELEGKYNIPATELAQCIQIPKQLTNKRLGRLRKSYDFQLNDLRNYIALKDDNMK